MENHAKYGEMIYASRKGELIVNMFIPSVLEWKEYGMTFTQETSFPEKESTRMVLHTDKSKKMKVSFRLSGMDRQVKGGFCSEWKEGKRQL